MSGQGNASGITQTFKTLSGLLLSIKINHRFAKDGGNHLYIYDSPEGCYKFNGVERLEKIASDLIPIEHFKRSKLAEAVKYFTVNAEGLWERPPMDKLNLKNGILNLSTMELEPHTHEYLSPIQLPIIYDPVATCRAWDKFCKEVLPEDEPDLAWELAAWLMLPNQTFQSCLVLLANSGANGKSIFLHGIKSFLGIGNYESHSLHDLVYNRFVPATLIGKLANICADIPNNKLVNSSIFKQITGGDADTGITVERKRENSFTCRPFARLVFSANQMPDSDDSSGGYLRRFKIVPFMNKFKEDPAMDKYLKEALASPGELSGLLNKALTVLPRVLEKGLTQSKSSKEENLKYARKISVEAQGLYDILIEQKDGIALKTKVLDTYNQRNLTPLTAEDLGRAMKRFYPDVQDARARRKSDGRLCRVFKGVRLVTDNPSGDALETGTDPGDMGIDPGELDTKVM